MKNKILLFLLLPFFLGLGACDDDDKDFIRLDKDSVMINVKGGSEIINITASGHWDIMGTIPEWISLAPNWNDISSEITINVFSENTEQERRKATLIFTCGEASQALVVEQKGLMDLAPFINVEPNKLSVGTQLANHSLKITSNTSWEITNLPLWVTATPSSATGSAMIVLSFDENTSRDGRAGQIVFKGKDAIQTMNIEQIGKKDIVWSPSLPIFKFKSQQFSSNGDDYSFLASEIFVNPSIIDRTFLGNLLSENAQSNTDIPQFTGYTFNPITVSTSARVNGEIAKTYVPSSEAQKDFIAQILLQNPTNGYDLVKDNGNTEFYSYKRLHVLGLANLGVKLDELINGMPYTQYEMSKEYGLIYSFKRTRFTTDIDIPDKLIKEELKTEDKQKGVSYVSSIKYGYLGLLIVETDEKIDLLRTSIGKVLRGSTTITQGDIDLINSSKISYVYFNNNGEVQVLKGHLDAIEAYANAERGKSKNTNIYPVGFELSDFVTHTPSIISFSIKLKN